MTKKEKRIVYIENASDSVYYCNAYVNTNQRFYVFHDFLAGEDVIIMMNRDSALYKAKWNKESIFLRMEKYYTPVWDSMHGKSRTAYFNAKPLTDNQIRKFKDENAELFI